EQAPWCSGSGDATDMKQPNSLHSRRLRQSMMAAVVLGTALTAFGPVGTAAAAPSEETLQAVQDISRYCTACWRTAPLHPDSWGDCTQDVFARLLQRINPDSWDRSLRTDGEERRELVRAIDAVKKRSQRQHRYASLASENIGNGRQAADEVRQTNRAAV